MFGRGEAEESQVNSHIVWETLPMKSRWGGGEERGGSERAERVSERGEGIASAA